MSNKESRAKFESWWSASMNTELMDLHRCQFPMTHDDDQPYACHETQRSWSAWQVAEANSANEIEALKRRNDSMNPWKVECVESYLGDKDFMHFCNRLAATDAHGNPFFWRDDIPKMYLVRCHEAWLGGLLAGQGGYGKKKP